jgi:hypothetical protein
MSWSTKILVYLLNFVLGKLLPDSNFVIWAFDTKQKQVKASIFLKRKSEGNYSYNIITLHNKAKKSGT